MTYTVNKLAKTAGISVRTLHYYDEIGLLKPSFIKDNGYRCYEEKQLLLLQQILFFRELEFPLGKIKHIIQSPGFDQFKALADQQKLLDLKKQRIEKLLTTISAEIKSLKGGETMSNDDKFSAFNDPAYQKYKDEVEERWGNTEAYQQSRERVGKMSKAQLDSIKTENDEITQTTAELMQKGIAFDSPEVQKQIGRFYQYLHHFYDPSLSMFKGLGQVYVDDPRFTAVYEKRAKGFARFMAAAMAFYAATQKK